MTMTTAPRRAHRRRRQLGVWLTLLAILGCWAFLWVVVAAGAWLVYLAATRGAFG